ncbi:MAG: hypothetical protein ACKVI4_15775 [Actinomycetales bacterium]|tara:strand:- start:419 stop:1147 length:729 start_codon:yes stop_codon:yes gene_type:complete
MNLTSSSNATANATANVTIVVESAFDRHVHHLHAIVTRVIQKLDEGPWQSSPEFTAALIVATPMVLLLVMCTLWLCSHKASPCCAGWLVSCYYLHEFCGWRTGCCCCRRSLAEQEELERGPDVALEDHMDELAEVDSIDEPVRMTPPVTDGEEEDEEEASERPPSSSRACCSSLAEAMASTDALANGNGHTCDATEIEVLVDAPQKAEPAPAPVPGSPPPKASRARKSAKADKKAAGFRNGK